jgi:hypothetical protein
VPISDTLRAGARKLIADYLNKAYEGSITQDQTCYISPLSSVCNDLWIFWETGRKILFFSAAAVLILTALDSRCGRDLLWEGNHEAGEGQEGGPWRAEVLLSGGGQKVFPPF